jgi:hypothetical protein
MTRIRPLPRSLQRAMLPPTFYTGNTGIWMRTQLLSIHRIGEACARSNLGMMSRSLLTRADCSPGYRTIPRKRNYRCPPSATPLAGRQDELRQCLVNQRVSAWS